jgi:hypothetical protein
MGHRENWPARAAAGNKKIMRTADNIIIINNIIIFEYTPEIKNNEAPGISHAKITIVKDINKLLPAFQYKLTNLAYIK